MRYELVNYEWTAIKPMLPNKPRGVPRVNEKGRVGKHPAEEQSHRSDLLQPLPLSRPQPGRTVLHQDQTMSSRRGTTGLPPTTSPSFNSRQLGYGCAFIESTS